MTQKITQDLLDQIVSIVGPEGVVTDDADKAPFLSEWRDKFVGATPMVVRPNSAKQISKVLALSYAADVDVVPQGGNTGLVGGQIPNARGDELLISLGRLNQIRRIDLDNDTVTVDAGCILSDIHQIAGKYDRVFPLSLASEGSAQIGGTLSTNAGGTNVLRYGNARDQVLGLEVVLPDGRIWDGLRRLRKDNTGYDLKQLFLGAEGTLGIITGAVLKLSTKPTDRATAFVGVASPEQAVELLKQTKSRFDSALTGFELIPHIGLEFVVSAFEHLQNPLDVKRPWYVLLEISSSDAPDTLWPKLEGFLAPLMDEGVVDDAVIALNENQRTSLWIIRDRLSEAQKHHGGSIKHDVSLPISEIAKFIEEACQAVQSLCPGVRPVPFGHLGDGNIHFNLSQPEDADKDSFLGRWEEFNVVVHDIVDKMDGSISAEHGIGQLKREEIKKYKSAIEMDLMRTVKLALDPKGLMNPGKVL